MFVSKNIMISRIATTIQFRQFKSYHTSITDKDDWNTITNHIQKKCIPHFENFLVQVKNTGDVNGINNVTDLIRCSKIIEISMIQAMNDIEYAKSSSKIQRDFIEGASSWYLLANEVKTNFPDKSISIDVKDSMENITVCIDKFNNVIFNFTNSHLPKE